MGKIVNLIDEIAARLVYQTGATRILDGVKMVRVGSFSEVRTDDALPIIGIKHTGGDESAENYQNKQGTHNVKLSIGLFVAKLAVPDADTTPNSTYDTATTSGATYWIERVLNSIERNTSNQVDLSFSGYGSNMRKISYSIDESSGIISVIIDFEITTAFFTFGGR